MDLKEMIGEFPDFPKKGILFRDFSPVLRSPEATSYVLDEFEGHFEPGRVDLVAGIESRGFPLACALAVRYRRGMVMIRKAGKLPGSTSSVSYPLEYGEDTVEIQAGAVEAGQRVLICDDLLATGGTAGAAARLVEQSGGTVAGFAFVIQLAGLGGDRVISRYDVKSLVRY